MKCKKKYFKLFFYWYLTTQVISLTAANLPVRLNARDRRRQSLAANRQRHLDALGRMHNLYFKNLELHIITLTLDRQAIQDETSMRKRIAEIEGEEGESAMIAFLGDLLTIVEHHLQQLKNMQMQHQLDFEDDTALPLSEKMKCLEMHLDELFFLIREQFLNLRKLAKKKKLQMPLSQISYLPSTKYRAIKWNKAFPEES